MCRRDERKEACRKPQHLKGEPHDCSPEQIRKCHGDAERHPCAGDEDCKERRV